MKFKTCPDGCACRGTYEDPPWDSDDGLEVFTPTPEFRRARAELIRSGSSWT